MTKINIYDIAMMCYLGDKLTGGVVSKEFNRAFQMIIPKKIDMNRPAEEDWSQWSD